MDHVQSKEANQLWLMGSGLAVALIAAAKLALHVYAGRHYGYFVDELYYLACARHLDWGYVDQPPLIAVIARVAWAVFGDSLSALRFPAALAGAGTAVLTGMIARELGGKRFCPGLGVIYARDAASIPPRSAENARRISFDTTAAGGRDYYRGAPAGIT